MGVCIGLVGVLGRCSVLTSVDGLIPDAGTVVDASLDATIDNHDTHHLAPSDCMEESGSDVQLHNASGGTVRGVYSRMYYLND